MPQERHFFDQLEQIAETVDEGAIALNGLLNDFSDVPAKRVRIKEIEHKADEQVHSVFEALNKTFITPIDREDIQILASRLDSVLDMIEAAASRLHLYGVDKPTGTMIELGQVIGQSTHLLKDAVHMIRNMRQANDVERISIEIHRLENVADDLMNAGVASLFKGSDAVRIIKCKEIIERLEEATDFCEDVANVLSDIVAKNQ